MGFLTTSDLAKIFDVTKRTAIMWCREGKFPNATQREGIWIVSKEDVLSHITNQKQKWNVIEEKVKAYDMNKN